MRVEKIKTWKDHWNDIIRYVLFQDVKLKELMCIPANTSIIDFVDKYFIENTSGDEILVNEKVRILYWDSEGSKTGNQSMKNMFKNFDIYVKEDVLHNADNDRLKCRYDLIAERLRYLLTREYHICNMHFAFENEFNLWTKTAGYRRYHVVFSYKKSV